MIRSLASIVTVVFLIVGISVCSASQSPAPLQTFLRQNIGLTQDQIAAVRSGKAFAKALPSRISAEVFLFGAIYIHATPERYLQFARDFDRLRKLPGTLALGVFSNPPQLSDLKDFSFDKDDIQALKNCKSGDCMIQMPASSIDALQHSISWSAPDVNEQVNQFMQKRALERLIAYQREGNQALGTYNDKSNPTVVPEQFSYMLSYDKVLPANLPDFYQYLIAYPKMKPANIEDTFYWERVKFGLKPTLRVVHMVTLRGAPTDPVACAIGEKQLYSSHYFETALDLSFCIRDSDNPKQPGFYLIMAMGSEQAGLTGAKGAIVRKVAVGRSVSSLQAALTTIRDALESKP